VARMVSRPVCYRARREGTQFVERGGGGGRGRAPRRRDRRWLPVPLTKPGSNPSACAPVWESVAPNGAPLIPRSPNQFDEGPFLMLLWFLLRLTSIPVPSSRPARRASRVGAPRFRPILEQFEDRTLLSTVTWVGGSGDWNTVGNWSDGATN